jgi:trk system potassium uptake protein TrkA
MLVLIVGGGRTGSQLAALILNQNQEVHLIDNRRNVLSQVHRELPTEIIYEGNPIDQSALEQAGIASADVVAAVTTSDEENLAICYIARSKYNVRRTIGRVNNPKNAWLFNETFHVDVAVNQAEIMSHIIEEEMSMGDMLTLLKLRRGKFSLITEQIPQGAKAVGVMIKDLALPEHCVIAAIIRMGEVIVPRGVTMIEAEDEVLAVTDNEGAKQLLALFATTKPAAYRQSAKKAA